MENLRDIIGLKDAMKVGGHHARTTLLAYAFLRDVPYRKCEPVTVADKFVESTARFHRFSLAKWIISRIPNESTSQEAVESWLATPETDDDRSARLRRIREAQQRRIARRPAR